MKQKELMSAIGALEEYTRRVKELRKEILPELTKQLTEIGVPKLIENIDESVHGNLLWMWRKMRRGYRYEIHTQYLRVAFKKLVAIRRIIKTENTN